MSSEQAIQSIETVKSALQRKGFEGLSVTHQDNTPGGHVALHDGHGLLARGDHEQVMDIIEGADDVDGLWSALDRAEMTRKLLAVGS